MKLVAKLYAIEKKLRDDVPAVRYQVRLEQSKPVIETLKGWLDETRPKVAPKTTLGKALQ